MFRVVFQDQFESAYTLNKEQNQLEIGRLTQPNDVVPPGQVKLDSKVISRKHAILMLKEDQLYIQDTKSSSGTFMNGIRLSPPGQTSEWRMITPTDTIVLGEDCQVEGITHTAVSMVCKQLQKFNQEPPKLQKLKIQVSSNSSLQSEIESAIEQSSPDNDQTRADIKMEFNAIWDTLQYGLEPHVKQYQKLVYPFMKTIRQTGIYGEYAPKSEKESRISIVSQKSGLQRTKQQSLPSLLK